jgi:hypothetical protein
MTDDPKAPKTRDGSDQSNRTTARPVARPMPKMDGGKPVPEGSDQVEKFNVATDTEGGD